MKKTAMFYRWLAVVMSVFAIQTLAAASQPEYSTAGFFSLPGTGREVYSMNPSWRFFKGDVQGAWQPGFEDSTWSIVTLPDGIEYLPTEASGCVNYQGPVW